MLYQLQRDKSMEVSGGGGMTTVPSVTSHPEEPSDLEELEQFARTFKQRRIKLGFTQVGRDSYCICVNVQVTSALNVLCFDLSKMVLPPFIFPPGRCWLGHGEAVWQ